MVVKLGPSGEASFTVTSKAPGAVVIAADVLNSVDVPVRVTATRRDGGAVWLAVAPTSDARAVLAGSAVSTVDRVHFPAGTMILSASGAGALPDASTADVWRLTARGARSAGLVVDQGWGPEALVVASGDSTALTDVTMTVTWTDRTWFFLALAAVMIGAIIAAFALNDLWQVRGLPGPTGVSGPSRSEAMT
jgi:hypothetical protein